MSSVAVVKAADAAGKQQDGKGAGAARSQQMPTSGVLKNQVNAGSGGRSVGKLFENGKCEMENVELSGALRQAPASGGQAGPSTGSGQANGKVHRRQYNLRGMWIWPEKKAMR